MATRHQVLSHVTLCSLAVDQNDRRKIYTSPPNTTSAYTVKILNFLLAATHGFFVALIGPWQPKLHKQQCNSTYGSRIPNMMNKYFVNRKPEIEEFNCLCVILRHISLIQR